MAVGGRPRVLGSLEKVDGKVIVTSWVRSKVAYNRTFINTSIVQK